MSDSDVGDALRAVVQRATAEHPARRFPSVAALRAAVVAIRQRTRLIHVRRRIDAHHATRFALAG
jgi:hypothetical protein